MKPPFQITPEIIEFLERISRLAGRCEGPGNSAPGPSTIQHSRVRTVRATLAIEGTVLSDEQVTDVLEGRKVAGPAREIREAENTIRAYDLLEEISPSSPRDFLKAHRTMMSGIDQSAGKWRGRDVKIVRGKHVRHVPPPHRRVEELMRDLFTFLRKDRSTHPLIKACVFHYEVELIHPFEDGNGRMGRLWQTLVFSRHIPLLAHVPTESVIHERRKQYYDALARSDRTGTSTPFVTFALSATTVALQAYLDELQPERDTTDSRLDRARDRIGERVFSRRDYMKAIGTISPATASRDLKHGVDSGLLEKTGERAVTRYRFNEIP